MKIGIDAQTILNPKMGDAAGLGHYTYQLIRYLLEIDQENEYVLYFSHRVREKDLEKFDKPNVVIRCFPFSQYKKYLPLAYSETLASAFFLRDNLDVLHVPGGRAPLTYKRKLIVTAHSLGIKKFPDLFSKRQQIKFKVKPAAFKRADMVIASSQAAKNDLKGDFQISDEKIKVIYNAFDEKFFKDADVSGIQKVKDKHRIDGEYILFMNTIKPLNNLTRLIEAFSKLRLILKGKKPNSNYKLVLAGKNGWLSDEIHQIAKDFGLKNEVIFPGYIDPEDLNALFAGADVFVSIPVYEDFGAPVLEAMASGIPVVCSSVSSLPEITNGAVELVDPYDVDGIKCAILKVLDDDILRSEMRSRGLQQARKFHWKKTAEKTLKVFEEVVG
ncbi:MAG: glycosyltransferase family 4 protein [Candidatus Pacebacteria bacterium]|nr:glycosyltransferase family 4 protein [Candidatus Paceibacterota bacterium]